MPQEDRYELWKRSRANTNVPDGFADRVMESVHETGVRGHQRLVGRLLLAVLATRSGRATVCVSAVVLFMVRVAHVFALFVAT